MKREFIYMIKVNLMICFLLAGVKASSQQDNHFLLENFAPLVNNPAYTGDKDLNDLILMTRQQWTGFEGAPVSYLLATQFSLRDKNASIGADIHNNSAGPVKETGVFFCYSYKVVLSDKSALYLGLKGGVSILHISLSDLLIIDPGDKLFISDVNNIILPNLGTGLHFVYQNYYFDFSVPSLIRNKLSPKGVAGVNNENREDRTVITGSGAKFQIGENIILHPAVSVWLVKGAPMLLETRFSATLQKLGAGLVYRPLSAVGGFIDYGFRDDIRVGYAFEFPVSMFSGIKTGTHEVFFGYNFSFTKQKTLSPRKF